LGLTWCYDLCVVFCSCGVFACVCTCSTTFEAVFKPVPSVTSSFVLHSNPSMISWASPPQSMTLTSSQHFSPLHRPLLTSCSFMMQPAIFSSPAIVIFYADLPNVPPPCTIMVNVWFPTEMSTCGFLADLVISPLVVLPHISHPVVLAFSFL